MVSYFIVINSDVAGGQSLAREMTDEEKNLIDENIFKDISVPYVFTPENPDRFQKIFFSVVEDFEKNNCISVSDFHVV